MFHKQKIPINPNHHLLDSANDHGISILTQTKQTNNSSSNSMQVKIQEIECNSLTKEKERHFLKYDVEGYDVILHSCRGLPSDVRLDTFEDIAYDISSFSTDDETSITSSEYFVNHVIYPKCKPMSSSVLELNHNRVKSDKNTDSSYIDILRTAYKGTNRKDNSLNIPKMKCSLISSDDYRCAVYPFEFESEHDYWSFIYAVRKNVTLYTPDNSNSSKRFTHVSGKCDYTLYLNNNNSSSNSNNNVSTNNPSGSLFGRLTNRIWENNSSDPHRYDIKANIIQIYDTKDEVLATVDLLTIKSMALTVDFDKPRDLLLEVGLANNSPAIISPAASSANTVLNEQHMSPIGKWGLAEATLSLSASINEENGSNINNTFKDEELKGYLTDSHAFRTTVPTQTTSRVSLSESHTSGIIGPVLLIPVSQSSVMDAITNDMKELPFQILISSNNSDSSQPSSINTSTGEIIGSQPISLTAITDNYLENNQQLFHQNSDNSMNSNQSNNNNNNESNLTFKRINKSVPRPVSPMKTSLTMAVTGRFSPPSSPKGNNTDRKSFGKPPLTHNNSANSPFSFSKRVIRFSNPYYSEVVLKQKSLSKAGRILIKKAENLPPTNPKSKNGMYIPPTAYCTAYLIGINGEKLTSNNIETRTEPIKSFDPEWNMEILMQDNKAGLDNISAVMILIRDAASGLLKHHHIGQVTIPITCFLYNTEAEFCLPLESTYRMAENLSNKTVLGDIFLTTQLVDVDITIHQNDNNSNNSNNNNNNNNNQTNKTRNNILTRKSVNQTAAVVVNHSNQQQVAYLKYTLHDVVLAKTWWPIKALLNKNLSNGDTGGYLLCSFDKLYFKLDAGASGILYNCKECHEGMITINFEEIEDIEDITEAALYITVNIMSCISNPTQAAKGELKYLPISMNLLVGPCPAAQLLDLIINRAKFKTIRHHLKYIYNNAHILKNYDPTQILPSGLMLSNNNNGRTRSFSFSKPSDNSIASNRLALIDYIRSTARQIEENMSLSENDLYILSMLPSNNNNSDYYSSFINKLTNKSELNNLYNIRFSSILSTLPTNNSNNVLNHAINERLKSCCFTSIARAKIYYAFLRHICRDMKHEDIPEYTILAMERFIDDDVECIEGLTDDNMTDENNDNSKVLEHYDLLLRSSISRIRDWIIFSGDHFNYNNQVSTVTTGNGTNNKNFFNYYSNILDGIEGIERIITGYYKAIIAFVTPYIRDRNAFKIVLKGLISKNNAMKLLIDYNTSYHDAIQSLLAVSCNMTIIHVENDAIIKQRPLSNNGGSLPNSPLYNNCHNNRLLLSNNVDEVLKWYGRSILDDMRQWLSAALKQAYINRTNTHELPWDIELLGDRYVSFLPETMRYELNIYLDRCCHKLNCLNEKKIIENIDYINNNNMTSPTSHPSDSIEIQEIGYVSLTPKQRVLMNINEIVLQSVGHSLLLLSDEYLRAIQCKHWDQGDRSTGELKSNTYFLIAILNDCHRVCTEHVTPLYAIHASVVVSDYIISSIIQSFNVVISLAIKNIVKIIFNDMIQILLEFENLWTDVTNGIARSISSTISYHLNELKKTLTNVFYAKLLPLLRILYFLRDRSSSSSSSNLITSSITTSIAILSTTANPSYPNKFSKEEISRFMIDLDILRICFEEKNILIIKPSVEKNNLSNNSNNNNNNNIFHKIYPIEYDAMYEELLLYVRYFNELTVLLSNEYDSIAYMNLVKSIVDRYYYYSQNNSNNNNQVVQALLIDVICSLRSDASNELTKFMTMTIESTIKNLKNNHNYHNNNQHNNNQHNNNNNNNNNMKGHDLYIKILCPDDEITSNNNNGVLSINIMNENTSGKMRPLSLGRSSSGIIDNNNGSSTPTMRQMAFMSPQNKPKNMNNNNHNHHNTHGLSVLSSSAAAISINPSSAMKQFREKAAEIALRSAAGFGGIANKRKNEEYAVSLMRTLGLETKRMIDINNNHDDLYDDEEKSMRLNNNDESDDDNQSNYSDNNSSSHPSMLAAEMRRNSKIFSNNPINNILNNHNNHNSNHNNNIIIRISHVSVRGLQSASFIGTANPYIVFMLGNQKLKSHVKWNTKANQQVDWKDDQFDFKICIVLSHGMPWKGVKMAVQETFT
eukprot:gene5386-7469_t